MIWGFERPGTWWNPKSVKYLKDDNYESVDIGNRSENRVTLSIVVKGMWIGIW